MSEAKLEEAVAWLRQLVRDFAHYDLSSIRHSMTILAHLDGEPGRIAAAREEQREVCARHIREKFLEDLDIDADSACLDAPLDSTPLADELERSWGEKAALLERAEKAEARVVELEADQHCPTCGSSVYTCVDCDVTPLRAERDTLAESLRLANERVTKMAGELTRLMSPVPGLAETGPYTAADVDAIEAHRGKKYERLRATVNERNVLRARVEAARELAEEMSNDTFDGGGETAAAGAQLLSAMDEAKP